MIGVSEVERNSDSAVFRTLNLGRAQNLGVLQLPPCRPLPSSNNENNFPFYFVADKASSPSSHKIFNETLSKTKFGREKKTVRLSTFKRS